MIYPNVFSINTYLCSLADKHQKEKKIEKNLITREIIRIMCSSYGSRITDVSRKYIKSILEADWLEYESQFSEYTYLGNAIGRTYLTAVAENEKGEKVPGVFLLQVVYNKDVKAVKDSHADLRESFVDAFQSVIVFIQEHNTRLSIKNAIINNFGFTINDRFGNQVNVKIHGESIELPFALAIFSALTNRELPSNICASGRLKGQEILLVDDLPEKISCALTEFSEIEKFLTPLGISSESKKGQIHLPVKRLENAIFHCYKDYKQIVERIKSPGIVSYQFTDVIVHHKDGELKGVELCFNYPDGEMLPVEMLKDLKSMALHTEGKDVIIVNNARASWLISFVTVKAKNVVNIISVFDPKITSKDEKKNAVVVYVASTNSIKDLDVGDTLSYTVVQQVIP